MTLIDDAVLDANADIVIQNCQGIIPFHEIFYVQSILYAADRGYTAFKRYDAALVEGAADGVIFALMQEAMTHAGALSRFFWPMKKKKDELSQARGRKLREAFGLTDASPLRSRRLRNAFEHFDEDLDRYLLRKDVGTFFPDPRVDDHTLADEEIGSIFKLVDPGAGICVILGQKFPYTAIRKEIENVLSLAGGCGVRGRLPDGGKTSHVDPDQAFARFHEKWSPRLGLKTQHLKDSLVRGQELGWAHIRPEEVPHTPGHIRVLLTLESASLLGSIEPGWLDDMVQEWQQTLTSRKGDLRKYTRRFIAESMALNRHRGNVADFMICGVLWLIVTKDDGKEAEALMRAGDVEVHYNICFEDDNKRTRFRLTLRECR